MEVATLPKRPWTIKIFVLIFGLLFGSNLITFFFDSSKALVLIYNLIILVSIYGIWQGRRWARNLFFILTIPYILLFGIASGATIFGFGNHESIWNELYLAIAMLSIPFLLTMIFLKPSREWFNTINHQSEETLGEFSWQFQLMIIVISIGLGFLAIAVSANFNLLPLAKQVLFLENNPSILLKVTILLLLTNLSVFLGTLVVQVWFWLILGIWKKEHKMLLWRLIVIGTFFPLFVQYFVFGESLKNIGMLGAIFGTNLLLMSTIAYIGLVVGDKIRGYYIKLKQLN
ncbi:MAG: hypothetical protein PHW18_07175 [Sulfuricurvum sp.]|uniref:hypothetical protein n=1 Tax=Sulfuricurvum sp. TaxID=2025608 RepID=UPI0026398A2B|nr:hypothetical protein [Sulfuricurvum sp.]MDD2829336.1 hypothetical protein [Sulfuricurvum sp.]MDD4948653.1 hypothetical protein [Sulfuricurvum sp.]